jgi:chromosome segregation ATPase
MIRNAEFMEGNSTKNVKNLNMFHGEIIQEISQAQNKISQHLKSNRDKVLQEFDIKIGEIKEQMEEERARRKDEQYDFKKKEKELKEHLETMTEVAQKIDQDNRVLAKKH